MELASVSFSVSNVLPWLSLVVHVAILVVLLRHLAQLRNIARLLNKSAPRKTAAEPSDAARHSAPVEVSPGTTFEAFLEEDPSRRKLAKSEQFKAYRAWRAERGLNWSQPGSHNES